MASAARRPSEPTFLAADRTEVPITGESAVDVSVIVVSYHCRDDVERCLRAVQDDSGHLAVEVFVVDNASADGTLEMVAEDFPSVRVIANDRNVGFAAANNQALVEATGRYVFLLNPDAFLVPGALATLVAFMDSHPTVGAVGPRLLNRDGSLQFSVRRFPSLTNAAFEATFLHRLLPSLTSRFGEVVVNADAYEQAHAVDWLSGAAMFVRRETVASVGPLDESFFLFAEETDWFKRMSDAGVPVWFVPDASAYHRDSDGGVNPELIGQGLYARTQYWKKHASPARAAIARGLLVTYVSLRIALWRLAGLSGGEYAADQYAAYRRGLADLRAGRSLVRQGGD